MSCRKRYWSDRGRYDSWPKCGGELVDRDERRRAWHESHRTKREAQRAVTDLLSKRDTNTYVMRSRQPVGEWLMQWLQAIRPESGADHLDDYRGHVVHHIAPSQAMGRVPLQELTAVDVKKLYVSLLQRTGPPARVSSPHRAHR